MIRVVSIILSIFLFWNIACVTAQAFSIEIARRMLMYSYASYCPSWNLDTWSCKFCEDNQVQVLKYFTDEGTNTFGYLLVNPDEQEVVLVFRGTLPGSLKNWLTDINAFHASFPFGDDPDALVAAGFFGAYLSVESMVIPAVRESLKKFPTHKFYVAGHSLGGALALFASLRIAMEGVVTPVLFTFGQPRVGNLAFSALFKRHVPVSFRLVQDADIVPHLPLLAMSFHHIGTEVWLQPDGKFSVCDGTGEDYNCSNSYEFPTSIYAHSHYMGILQNCYDEFNNQTAIAAHPNVSIPSEAAQGQLFDSAYWRSQYYNITK